jgi:hypothetical protein
LVAVSFLCLLALPEKLLPIKPDTPLPPGGGEAALDEIEPVGGPMVLLTKDNFDAVEYNSRFIPLTNPNNSRITQLFKSENST